MRPHDFSGCIPRHCSRQLLNRSFLVIRLWKSAEYNCTRGSESRPLWPSRLVRPYGEDQRRRRRCARRGSERTVGSAAVQPCCLRKTDFSTDFRGFPRGSPKSPIMSSVLAGSIRCFAFCVNKQNLSSFNLWPSCFMWINDKLCEARFARLISPCRMFPKIALECRQGHHSHSAVCFFPFSSLR